MLQEFTFSPAGGPIDFDEIHFQVSRLRNVALFTFLVYHSIKAHYQKCISIK